ncbi:MAG: hypothetical protein ABIN67_01040 [Ferruginibacter sp.]
MNKFLKKSLLFFAVVVIVIFVLNLFQKEGFTYNTYFASTIDKHKLIDSITSPAIILAGGSNLAFGIDSKEIEKASGMPVVNLGLNGALGLDFILNELKYSIKENDIVFLSVEYFLPQTGKYDFKKILANFYPPAHKFYNRNYLSELEFYLEYDHKIFKNIFSKNSVLFQKAALKTPENPIYSREAFNRNGDVISHLNQPNNKQLNDRSRMVYRYWEGINAINQFYDFARTKNVTLFFVFPDYAASEYEKNKRAIAALESDLRKNLKAEIINSPGDLVFADSCFFDTVYHLNKLGREQRTEKLIELIKTNTHIQSCIAKAVAPMPAK